MLIGLLLSNTLKIDKKLRINLSKVYAVGVGPGSSDYVTEIVKEIVEKSDIIVGYKYTLKTIERPVHPQLFVAKVFKFSSKCKDTKVK